MRHPAPPELPVDPGRTAPADVTVVIVSYNTADLLARCLRSVRASARRPPAIVIVDNASSDSSVAVARREAPGALIVEMDENVGFAAGVNEAARRVTSPWILLLNPDAVLAPGAVDELVAFAHDHPGRGLYGGRAVRDDGSTDPRSCWGLPSPWSLFCFATGLSSAFRRSSVFDPESLGHWDRDSVREVGAISGALLLVERSAWERLGGFDTTYFMYSEDIDLCARARSLGYRPTIDPHAIIRHEAGASSTPARKAEMVLTGKATYLRRRWSRPARAWGLAMLWCGVGLRAAAATTLRRADSPWPHVWRSRRRWVAGYAPQTAGEERAPR